MDLCRSPRPAAAAADKALHMLSVLQGIGRGGPTDGWMTRRRLAEFGLTPRDCRAARQASRGRIILGQRGYKATADSSIEEIQHAAHTLSSQARAMLAEASELWRVYHARRKEI